MELLNASWVPGLIEDGVCEINPATVRPVASYSWLAHIVQGISRPTVVVPGCPRIWDRRKYPFTVDADTGTEYGDPNRSEFPSCPMLPLFLSVQLMEPKFKFESMDIICDKSVLRNMLRWVQHGKEGVRDFMVESELLGDKTLVLFQPSADKPYKPGLYRKNLELVHSSLPHGWEDTFGHHRVISYELGNLKVLVRFPVDICNPQPENDPFTLLSLPNSCAQNIRDYGEHETRGLCYIQHPGRLVYQNAMTELIVRDHQNDVDWDWVWHQLYFSWTHKLFVVSHHRDRVHGMTQEFLTRTGGLKNAVENARKDLKNVEVLLGLMRQYLEELIKKEMPRNSSESSATGIKLRFDFFKNVKGVRVYKLCAPSNIPPLEL